MPRESVVEGEQSSAFIISAFSSPNWNTFWATNLFATFGTTKTWRRLYSAELSVGWKVILFCNNYWNQLCYQWIMLNAVPLISFWFILLLLTELGVPDDSLRSDLKLPLEDELVLQVGVRLGAAVVLLHLALRGAAHDLESGGRWFSVL